MLIELKKLIQNLLTNAKMSMIFIETLYLGKILFLMKMLNQLEKYYIENLFVFLFCDCKIINYNYCICNKKLI